ncbi:MAG: DUF1566 domain-containing protein [Deltaproteobacteria bacterium]|nr:DUF1566 domain-containing protein [Deltaproteobacteria bacterium]
MGIFAQLGMEKNEQATIDWDITPANSFTIFESWGSKERLVRNKSERYYYFYIDNWQSPARVCLMERGIKHAEILAEIEAPAKMVARCVKQQGHTSGLDRNYAIDEELKAWLKKNILAKTGDNPLIKTIIPNIDYEDMQTGLPGKDDPIPTMTCIELNHNAHRIVEGELKQLVRLHNFFDSRYNPEGRFANCLIDNGDRQTVTDLKTGIMWQRHGCDITSIRHIREFTANCNKENYAGFNDWRQPAMEEVWSLMEPELNNKGLYLHPCFSRRQPFIFTANQRDPGGFWFADFKQGTVFWASGTIPGGFGRLCRTVGR